jgi:hypothetical protein
VAFKTFVAAATLPASDLNTYLMKQSIIACTSGSRPSSPQDGMPIYETDTDRFLIFDGSAWIRMGWTSGTGRTEYRARHLAGTTSADTAVTAVSWGTEVADVDGFAAGGTTITVPAGLGGIYAITVDAVWTTTFTSTVPSTLTLTTTPQVFRTGIMSAYGNGSLGVVVPLAAADTVSLSVYQNSGSTRTIDTATEIFMYRLGG